MTPALLRQVGEALYGARWQTALAGDLGVADRTMRHWLAGAGPIPAGVASDCLRLIVERQADLDAVTEALKRAG